MRVSKWGNSLALRIPAEVVEALELKEGDEIQLRAIKRNEFGVAKQATAEDVIRAFRKFRGRVPPDFKFDRDEANSR